MNNNNSNQTHCFICFFCKNQDCGIIRNYSQADVKSENKFTDFVLPQQLWLTKKWYGDDRNKTFIKYTCKYIMCYENKKADFKFKQFASDFGAHSYLSVCVCVCVCVCVYRLTGCYCYYHISRYHNSITSPGRVASHFSDPWWLPNTRCRIKSPVGQKKFCLLTWWTRRINFWVNPITMMSL